MADDLASIGEMCREFGVTPRTLRFYESRELLFPRREGTKRLFTRRCRARLKLILQGKRFGFSLEDIRQLLELYDIGDGGSAQMARTCELGRERLRAMRAQRDELEVAIADLEQQLQSAAGMLARRAPKYAPDADLNRETP